MPRQNHKLLIISLKNFKQALICDGAYEEKFGYKTVKKNIVTTKGELN